MNQDMLKSIMAERIKTCRESYSPRMTQSDLAKKLGVDKALMSKYENSKYPDMPPHRVLNQIGDIFKVSLDYLNGRVSNPYTVFSEYIGKNFSEKELKSLDQQKIDKIIQYVRDQVDLAHND